MNILDHIFPAKNPEAPAIIAGDTTLTFSDLETAVSAAAEKLPCTPRQRIGLDVPNGIDHIILSLAILKQQGCLVPLPSELTPSERRTLIDTTALHGILSTDGLTTNVTTAKPTFPEDNFNQLNPALIRFSSGTTGTSKGVILSHETLLARVTTCNHLLQIGPTDRIIWMLPMAHHFAVSIILYLLHGATTIICQSHLAENVLTDLQKNAGTILYASPFHYALLAAHPSAAPCQSLRLAVSTAAPLPATTATLFKKQFHLPLTQGFGIIECGLPLLNTRDPENRPGAVGWPQSNFQIKLAKDSELLLKGPGIFDAYLTPWHPFTDEWFPTGDLATQDSDGCITISGRKKSVINVGGMKCFAEEIEAVLNAHPGIIQSRVTGIPHPITGQIPAAEIIAKEERPTKAALLKHCRATLSNYKIPAKITFVCNLPKTASGKLKRA